MELMAVVCIIGILSVAAIPSMNSARIDRHVYDDAAAVADLIREARSLAIGRGAAVLVQLKADGTPGNMLFNVSEAVGPNPGTTPTPAADNRVPIASCKTPTRWVASATLASNANPIRTIDWTSASSYELTNGISGQLVLADGSAVTEIQLCFTPSGRSYMISGATPSFDALGPMSQAFEIRINRKVDGVVQGLQRFVVVPPTGVTRVRSTE